MKAKITRKEGYDCAPNGHTVEHFAKGAEVEGQVAEWAVKDGAAKQDKMTAAEKKAAAKAEKAELARLADEEKAAEAEQAAAESDAEQSDGTDDTPAP